MGYPALVILTDEADYLARFHNMYCCGPIITFDGIAVRFRKHQFAHCFYESSQRNKIKDVFSVLRAERIDWIKAALVDPASERYWGWDSDKKQYDQMRRVTVVMGNYVVVIMLTGATTADFVTAYVADTPGVGGRKNTIDRIRSGPKCA